MKLHWEMGITRSEFMRLLPVAVGGEFSQEADRLWGTSGLVAWEIHLREKPPRRIALLALPVLDVTLALGEGREGHLESFVNRFLQAFQRGGG